MAHALPADGDATWIRAALSLLRPGGQLVMIHRADALARLLRLRGPRGRHPVETGPSAKENPATRILLKAVKASRAPLTCCHRSSCMMRTARSRPRPKPCSAAGTSVDWDT